MKKKAGEILTSKETTARFEPGMNSEIWLIKDHIVEKIKIWEFLISKETFLLLETNRRDNHMISQVFDILFLSVFR